MPPLKDTIETLKETLKPIAWDESEYATVLRKVDEFSKGPAQELQKRLVERQAETEHWLEEWWDDGGYLTYRDSVCLSPTLAIHLFAHPRSRTGLHQRFILL